MKVSFEKLELNGFLEIETTEAEFVSLSQKLGTATPSRRNSSLIDELKPLSKEEAHPFSLSKIYGHYIFPFHTDGAYFITPPKYILLRFLKGLKESTPTQILPLINNLDNPEKNKLQNEFWVVKGRQFNFYSSILEKKSEHCMYMRFDPGCMKPLINKSYMQNLLNIKINQKHVLNIEWYEGKTLVINNWKTLHARPQVKPEEINFRTLQRIMINE